MREHRHGGIPEIEDVTVAVRVGEVGPRIRAQPHGVSPLVERGGLHHAEELFAAAELAVFGRPQDVDPPVVPVDHRAQVREHPLAGLEAIAVAVAKAPRHQLAAERYRDAVEHVVVQAGGIDRERIDLPVVHVVVGRRESEVRVESADDPERSANPEVPVEVEAAWDDGVSLPVARVPRQVRTAQQNRRPGGGAARRECPRARARFEGIAVGRGIVALKDLAGEQAFETAEDLAR